jgi:p-aminobenzoyl-glutamate transporter AbgT
MRFSDEEIESLLYVIKVHMREHACNATWSEHLLDISLKLERERAWRSSPYYPIVTAVMIFVFLLSISGLIYGAVTGRF